MMRNQTREMAKHPFFQDPLTQPFFFPSSPEPSPIVVQHEADMLTHFLANLPAKPYCSDDLSRLNIRPAKIARKYAYIQPNNPYNIRWLVFDLDLGAESFFQYEDKNLPPPNIVVQNPENGNCHYLYMLKNPVWVKNTGRKAPQAYLEATRIAMTRLLHADPRYTGLICKNPLNTAWRATQLTQHLYSLDDLTRNIDAENLNLSAIEKYRAKAEKELENVVINGRNDHLFTTLRFYAYQRIPEFAAWETLSQSKLFTAWENAILYEARRINSEFGEGLPVNEIKSTAKSVSRWVWDNYQVGGGRVRRGKMGFGQTRHKFNFDAPMLPVEERKRRQSLSAELTNKHRKESTELKIKQAIERLQANGEKVTKSAVARMTGLAREVISRNYAHFFEKKV